MSSSRDIRQHGPAMVRLQGELTAWFEHLNAAHPGGVARGDTDADDDLEWLDEESDVEGSDEDLPNLLDPLEALDPEWLERWVEFEESLGDEDQADEG